MTRCAWTCQPMSFSLSSPTPAPDSLPRPGLRRGNPSPMAPAALSKFESFLCPVPPRYGRTPARDVGRPPGTNIHVRRIAEQHVKPARAHRGAVTNPWCDSQALTTGRHRGGACRWATPPAANLNRSYRRVAQWLEREAYILCVAGSIPAAHTIFPYPAGLSPVGNFPGCAWCHYERTAGLIPIPACAVLDCSVMGTKGKFE